MARCVGRRLRCGVRLALQPDTASNPRHPVPCSRSPIQFLCSSARKVNSSKGCWSAAADARFAQKCSARLICAMTQRRPKVQFRGDLTVRQRVRERGMERRSLGIGR